MIHLTRRSVRAIAVLGLTALAPGSCTLQIGDWSSTDEPYESEREVWLDFAIAKDGLLEVHDGRGAIEVIADANVVRGIAIASVHARGESDAEAVARAAAVTVHADDAGGDCRLAARSDGSGLHRSVRIDWRLLVPPGVAVDLDTTFGDIELTGAIGAAAVGTDFGDVTIRGAGGARLSAHTSSGEIELLEPSGPVESIALDSSFGDIVVRGYHATESLVAKTSSGGIELDGVRAPRVEAVTSFGDVRVDGTFGELVARSSSGSVDVRATGDSQPTGDWLLQTSFGDVDLQLPRSIRGCEVELKTSFGDVDTDRGLSLAAGSLASNSSIRGTIGAGGPRIRLVTSSGDVHLR